MLTALVLLLVMVVSLVALGLGFYGLYASRQRDRLAGRTIAVHTIDDRLVRGVLVATTRDRLILQDAVLLLHGAETDLGGVQHIPLTNVSFIQDLVAIVEPRKQKVPFSDAPVTELAARRGSQ